MTVQLEISDVAFGGRGVARYEGKVCFLPFVVPGERVTARIVRDKKKFAEAELLSVETASPDRVEPVDKEAPIELEGTVSAVLAGTMFKVKLRNGHEVLAHISGKMRKRFIRLVIGDQVKIEMSPYDADKARIVYRL